MPQNNRHFINHCRKHCLIEHLASKSPKDQPRAKEKSEKWIYIYHAVKTHDCNVMLILLLLLSLILKLCAAIFYKSVVRGSVSQSAYLAVFVGFLSLPQTDKSTFKSVRVICFVIVCIFSLVIYLHYATVCNVVCDCQGMRV